MVYNIVVVQSTEYIIVQILCTSTILYLYSVKLHSCRSKVQATQVAGRQEALQARGLISVVVELMVSNSKKGFLMTSFGNDKLCFVHSTVVIGRRKYCLTSFKKTVITIDAPTNP